MSRFIASLAVVSLALVLFSGAAYSNARTDDPLGVAVSPQTLLLSSDQGGEVSVHTAIPYGAVDRSTIELNGVAVAWTKADSCGNLVAKFDEAAIKAVASAPETIFTLTGLYDDGEPFSGSDTVRVIP